MELPCGGTAVLGGGFGGGVEDLQDQLSKIPYPARFYESGEGSTGQSLALEENAAQAFVGRSLQATNDKISWKMWSNEWANNNGRCFRTRKS
jgi:hypothetical protein